MLKLVSRVSLVLIAFVFMLTAVLVAEQSGVLPAEAVLQQPPAATPPVPSGQPAPAAREAQKPDPAGKARPRGATADNEKPAAEKPAAPAPPETPPDRAAYLAATKIADQDKKIAAIENWLKEYPDSGSVASAYSTLFDTLLKHRPTDRAAIIGYAESTSRRRTTRRPRASATSPTAASRAASSPPTCSWTMPRSSPRRGSSRSRSSRRSAWSATAPRTWRRSDACA
jgi:hypothetical protein